MAGFLQSQFFNYDTLLQINCLINNYLISSARTAAVLPHYIAGALKYNLYTDHNHHINIHKEDYFSPFTAPSQTAFSVCA